MFAGKHSILTGTAASRQFITSGLMAPGAQTRLPDIARPSLAKSSAAEKLADPLLMASLGRVLGKMHIRRRRGIEDCIGAAHSPLTVRGKSTLDEGLIIEGTSEAFSGLGGTLQHFSSAKSFRDIKGWQNSQLRLVIDALDFSAGYSCFAQGGTWLPAEEAAGQLAGHLYEKLYKTGKLLSLFNSGLSGYAVSPQELEASVNSSSYSYMIKFNSLPIKHCASTHSKMVERVRLIGRAAADLFYIAGQFGLE